jgi:hypothetical protein
MKSWLAAASLFLIVAAGCASNEPEGFKPGDTLDLDGKPRPIAKTPEKAGTPGAPAAGEKVEELKGGDTAASKAEQKNTLGYAPDASGAPGS